MNSGNSIHEGFRDEKIGVFSTIFFGKNEGTFLIIDTQRNARKYQDFFWGPATSLVLHGKNV